MGDVALRLVTVSVDELRALVREAVREAMNGAREDPGEILTREEAAAFLKVHPVMISRYVKEKGLPGKRLGYRGWRFRRSDLVAWLQEQAVKPGAPTERYAKKLRDLGGE